MTNHAIEPGDIPKLGELEIAALEYVWANARVSAKVVHKAIGVSRGISPNTVQSALERLYRKGVLAREKKGHSYRYTAQIAREELIARFIGSLLGRFGAEPSAALAAFVEVSDELDPEELRRLELILRERRETTS